MKTVVLALAVLLASVSAVPQSLIKQKVTDQKDQRIVDDILVSIILDWATSIQDRGLDPYNLDNGSIGWSLPVPGIASIEIYGQNVELVGLSQIVINGVSYNILTGQLHIDISLPRLHGAVGNCGGSIILLGNIIDGEGSGEITATGARVVADANVRIGLTGVTVTNVVVVGSIENISAEISVTILGVDLSAYFNAFFNEILLRYLNEFADEINELLSYYALVFINNRLP